jgi:mRNA-degrading endonuclease RelE of RelBE toxin-antitoxin system
MKLAFTKPFIRDYRALPTELEGATDKALRLLLKNPRHPSLGIKKMQPPTRGIFEGRISKGYRFTFIKVKDVYLLRRVGTHDVLRKP